MRWPVEALRQSGRGVSGGRRYLRLGEEQCRRQVRPADVRVPEIDTQEIAPGEVDASEIGCDQKRPAKIGCPQIDPAKVDAFNKAQDQLKGSLSRLMMTTEAYPDLKASAQFQDLSKQIEGSENRLLRSREEYNKAVGSYNTELRKIRGSAVNKATGKPFKERAYFKASEESKVAPKVSF